MNSGECSKNIDSKNKGKSAYEDIINFEWKGACTYLRVPMSLRQRAKIFLPFAALTGYEAEVEQKQEENIRKSEQKTHKFYEEC